MAEHAAAAAAADGGASGDQGIQAPLVANNNGHQPRPSMFPLNEQAFIGFLSKVADAAVMGLLTLNLFSATFFLAWGKPGSPCLPKAHKDKPKLLGDDHFTLLSWVKVAIIGLPFVIYPATVFVSGLVKAVEQGCRGLQLAATLCLTEFVYGLLIGGLMTVCMSGAAWLSVLRVTIALNVLLLLTWGWHFEYPTCLRYAMSGACFRRQAAPAQEVDDQNNNPVAPHLPEIPPDHESVETILQMPSEPKLPRF